MNLPLSLSRSISPPPRTPKRCKSSRGTPIPLEQHDTLVASHSTILPTLAAVEAGREKVENHIVYFKEQLSKSCRERKDGESRIDIDDWVALYERNEHEHGNHFVVHQHNHPISGVHYDLRLQFSKTSSISFALPKGLPGNPNSRSLGRMAIETRVHNLWNHFIESASHGTGSLLIWDTGTYEILPRKVKQNSPPSPQTSDDNDDNPEDMSGNARPQQAAQLPENEKLIHAFRTRNIRIRLHGTRLPHNYTITLRLPSANDFGKPGPRFTRKRRANPRLQQPEPQTLSTDSDDEPTPQQSDAGDRDIDTDDEEDAQTRLRNAYPGSTNSIGSVHQRRWFLLLDRASSGFVLEMESSRWIRKGPREGEGFEPFFVRGRDLERSVVTGRLAREVESDEGVEGFAGRSGWVGITA